MDSYIKTNIRPSILFSPSSAFPSFKGTFAIFLQAYFNITHPAYENLEKYLPPLLISLPTTIKHKRVNASIK